VVYKFSLSFSSTGTPLHLEPPVAQRVCVSVALIIIFNARSDRIENGSPCKDWLLDVPFRPFRLFDIKTYTRLSFITELINARWSMTKVVARGHRYYRNGRGGERGREGVRTKGTYLRVADDRDVISFAVAASIYM